MVRRTAVVLLAALGSYGIAACTGDIDQGEATTNLDPKEQVAQTAWIKRALPALKAGMCNTCHQSNNAAAPAYMGLATDSDLDIRTKMVAFVPTVINLGSPKTSTLILKGMHEGPPLGATEISDILYWITYEQIAKGSGTAIETMPTALDCPAGAGNACNPTTIDLSAVGSTGSTITFVAQQLAGPNGPDLYLQQLKVTAGPSGLTMVHPIFKSHPSGSGSGSDVKADSNDTFYNVNLSLAASATALLGMGSASTSSLAGFAADPISVQFDTLSTK